MTQVSNFSSVTEKPALFLIHGWNMPPLIWKPLKEQLRERFDVQVATLPGYEQASNRREETYSDVLGNLLEQAPERAHWCGWSLGATLSMRAAISVPERISRLTLISPTARFIRTDDWPQGISASIFERLFRITNKKYEVGLKRFLQMQLPDDNNKDLLNQLAAKISNNRPSEFALQSGYATLRDFDLRDQLAKITMPTQVIAATSDNVIPPVASRLCAEQIPNATFQTLGNCHCLPATHPVELAKFLLNFSDSKQTAFNDIIDRDQVARQFSKAAESYDSAAQFQRELGQSLISQIQPNASGTLVDLGCGTGDALKQIKTRWPELQLIGVDIASAMVAKAQTRVTDSKLLVADIERTGLPAESVNIVFSSAAMQWCDPSQVAAEAFRLLKPGGQLLMTTFTLGTLPEFREAWLRVRPDLNRVHELATATDWKDALVGSGLQIKQLTQSCRHQAFESVDELLIQFRKLGASYAGRDRTRLSRVDYENFREQLSNLVGDSPKLTYECLTVLAEKPIH